MEKDIYILNGYVEQVQRYYMPYIQRCVELGRLNQSEQFSMEMNEVISNIQEQIRIKSELVKQLSNLKEKGE